MRTTIELTDEQRAKLLALAARRGQKGFSRLIQEALNAYLNALEGDKETRNRALSLRGSLRAEEANRLREATHQIRDSRR